MDAWLQLQRDDPSSCTLDQLRGRGSGLEEASARLQALAATASYQLAALQASIHAAQAPAAAAPGAAAAAGSKARAQKGENDKKPAAAGGGAVGAARRTAMGALHSRADGLSLRLHAASGTYQRLSRAAAAMRAQADAVSGLPALLRELLAGPLAGVQAAAGGAHAVLQAALISSEATAATAAASPDDDDASAAAAVLRAALNDSPLLMEHATVLQQQVEELLGQVQALVTEAGQLQVRGRAWSRSWRQLC